MGLAAAAGAQPAERPVPTVRDLAVEGNRRVQAAAVLNRIQTRIGDAFSPSAIREDVRQIFALGFFDDVQVRTEEFEGGVRIVFVVAERGLLREVSFEGNYAVTTEDLREKAAMRVGVLYNPMEVQRAQEAIRQKYEDEGYFGAVIAPRTERSPEGDLRVVFRIEEGAKTYIDRIVIEGNQALTAGQIKDAMATKERYLWILPFSTVQRRVFEDDAERILALYADHGYIQARVESQEIAPDVQRGKVTLRVRIVEGTQFRTGSVVIRGNQVLPTDELRRLVRLREGEVFNRGALRASVRTILDRYAEMGRARADVSPETRNDVENRRVDVAITIAEGGEVYVERINITGNVKSSEKVLRRELRIAEGDLFVPQKLVRSRQRMFNLGYFEEVNVATDPGSTPDRVVINIEVKERATGVFSIGAGYSSTAGPFATLDVRQRNLFGLGYEGFLRVTLGTKSRLGLLGFTDPYFLDTRLRAGFDIYNRDTAYDNFDENRFGGDLRASYPVTEYLSLSGTYRLEDVEIDNVPPDDPYLVSQSGTFRNSELDLVLAYDTRDNIFEPNRGTRTAVDLAFAGLGGDTQFYRVVIDSGWYLPTPITLPSGPVVVGMRAMGGIVRGWGGKEVPVYERFFLGGPTTLRGFEARSVGTKSAAGNTIGGTSEVLFQAEVLIPIIARFRVAFFFDAGNAWDNSAESFDLRYDIGAGIRLFSPLGPLRLDYGYNLNRRSGEKMGAVQFTVGSPF